MKELTMYVKRLTPQEKMDIMDIKLDRIRAVNYRCEVCNIQLEPGNQHMSHIVPKWENNVEKYSYEAIHHHDNIKITCSNCNSSVMISGENAIKKHFVRIYLDLIDQGYDLSKLPRGIYERVV
jgi:hypothetical protein